MKLYTVDFIDLLNNDWKIVGLYGSRQILCYENVGEAADNNSYVFGMKEESEQF